jgi:hypothetical protein
MVFGRLKMEILILENGMKAKLTATASIHGKTVIDMKANGIIDSNMAKGLIFLQMEIHILGNITKVNRMEKVNTNGNNGSVYSGTFKNGLKHGKGKWKKGSDSSKSNSYDGEYFMDKKHGYGIFNWASGNVYKGNYKEDERHGYGEMYWIDGSIYKGEWVRGIQHGFGEMIFPDGTKKVGIFDHNTFVSPVNGELDK